MCSITCATEGDKDAIEEVTLREENASELGSPQMKMIENKRSKLPGIIVYYAVRKHNNLENCNWNKSLLLED